MMEGQKEQPRIDRVTVRWNEKYANSPEFVLFVDDAWNYIPYSEVEHRELASDRDGTLYFASDDPFAHFVYDRSERDRNAGQFQGQCKGELLLKGGETKQVTSGWTSRAGVVNNYLPEEDHVMDVTLIGGQYTSGRAGIAVKVNALREMLPEGVHIIKEERYGTDITYYPSVDPNKVVKAS